MANTRTGDAAKKLVEAIQDDLKEAREHFAKGLAIVDRLEGEAKGVNGLSSFLKSKSNEVKKMISDMEEEGEAVRKKMIGATLADDIKTKVNPEHPSNGGEKG